MTGLLKNRLSNPVVLSTRRESPVFSKICDHAVVYDSALGTPVFVVESKKPWRGKNLTSKMLGQVYDQLMGMHAMGHPNPFGALTCFNQTYIVWLKNESSKRVLQGLSPEREWERLARIAGQLSALHETTQSSADSEQRCQTQSPVKERQDPVENDGRRSRRLPIFLKEARKICHSKGFASRDMILAFVSAIFCSLDGLQRPPDINSFARDEYLKVGTLSLTTSNYHWGTLETIYLGDTLTRRQFQLEQSTLYVVDYLGMGATSKAYRAITRNGYECVVKMYVNRHDDNEKLMEDKKFKRKAANAVAKEVKAYRQFYSELNDYVWGQVLNGFSCVIHPYFKHPLEDERGDDLLERIRARLEKFGEMKMKFDLSDQLWRHVGFFNDKVYLFDLGDLVRCKRNDTMIAAIDSHIVTLRNRI